MNKNREDLLKAMQENPELPIIFMASSDELEQGRYTVYESWNVYVTEIYKIPSYYNEITMTDDLIEVQEYYEDCLADEEEYKNLSDKEFEEAVKEYIEENVEHYKAIVVTL